MDDDRSRSMRHLFALLREAGSLTRDDRLALYQFIVCRNDIYSTDDLNDIEVRTVIHALRGWKADGRLTAMVRSAVHAMQ
jgi:hypothetical protein